MKTCRHLKAFRIDATATDPSHAGLPPWMALCENCAADVVAGLRHRIADIVSTKHSGKSSAAVTVAHLQRILDDLLGWQMEWRPNDETVVEQFKARLGADYFNHGGLLRVMAKGSPNPVGDQSLDDVHELQDGDWLIIDADGKRRVSLKGATA
jgi:hypothetical protein